MMQMTGLEWISSYHMLTALAEWCACAVYLLLLPRKKRNAVTVCRLLFFFFFQTALVRLMTRQMITSSYFLDIWVRVGIFVLSMWSFLFFAGRMGKRETTYCCCKAFLAAEFVWGAAITADKELTAYVPSYSASMYWCMIFLVYGLTFAILYLFEQYSRKKIGSAPATGRELRVTLLLCFATLAFDSSKILRLDFLLYDTTGLAASIPKFMVDFLGMFFVFEYRLWYRNLEMEHELEIIQKVVENQKTQYQQSGESMELMNQKYHDLKNQLLILRAQIPRHQQEQWIDQMEEEIRQYESLCDTGNPMLDTILREKYIICQKRRISFGYLLDGKLFEAVDAADLCTIFGNALDNAIECVSQIAQEEKRQIFVCARCKNHLLSIRFENACEHEIEFSDGLPVTTKENRRLHGYGLKGIRYAAEKYNGALSIETKKEWFLLSVMLSLPETA